jgi:hypothetical protein
LDRYGLDPLQAIPAEKIEVPDFKAKRWPQLLEASKNAREARARKAAKKIESRKLSSKTKIS